MGSKVGAKMAKPLDAGAYDRFIADIGCVGYVRRKGEEEWGGCNGALIGRPLALLDSSNPAPCSRSATNKPNRRVEKLRED